MADMEYAVRFYENIFAYFIFFCHFRAKEPLVVVLLRR